MVFPLISAPRSFPSPHLSNYTPPFFLSLETKRGTNQNKTKKKKPENSQHTPS